MSDVVGAVVTTTSLPRYFDAGGSRATPPFTQNGVDLVRDVNGRLVYEYILGALITISWTRYLQRTQNAVSIARVGVIPSAPAAGCGCGSSPSDPTHYSWCPTHGAGRP